MAQPKRKSGYIYLLNARGTNRYKIGLTQRTVEQRLKEINSKQSPFPIDLVHYVSVRDVRAAEKELHHQFAEYKKHNEWFEFTPLRVKQVQREMNIISGSSRAAYSWDNIGENILALGGAIAITLTLLFFLSRCDRNQEYQQQPLSPAVEQQR